ncbi:helicase associated domain-containing protein [Streptomyces sp. NPDC007164]|uniref:helicase associated domain-containing protein n=1 Tax=Streptomyces sp. NPDC007164 TaxID=3156918 RepID=UPI0033E52555
MELPAGTADRLLAQVRLLMVRQVTSLWWEGYGHATTYREQHDHLDVPAEHVTDSGHRLVQWIINARQHHRKGWMPADRITALDRLGMIWDTEQQALAHVRTYRDHHGHLAVPQAHRTSDGYPLGSRINVLRRTYAKGQLAQERIDALEELGMVWDTRDQANEQLIAHARAYHGHLRVPRDHVTQDGYPLGNTLKIRRSRYAHGNVHTDVVQALDELGMIWDLHEARFADGLAACHRYRERHGDLRVPVTFIEPEGYNLGDFIAYQRALHAGSVRDRAGRTRTLLPERRAALDELGMLWTVAAAGRPPTDAELAARPVPPARQPARRSSARAGRRGSRAEGTGPRAGHHHQLTELPPQARPRESYRLSTSSRTRRRMSRCWRRSATKAPTPPAREPRKPSAWFSRGWDAS